MGSRLGGWKGRLGWVWGQAEGAGFGGEMLGGGLGLQVEDGEGLGGEVRPIDRLGVRFRGEGFEEQMGELGCGADMGEAD